MDVLHLFSINNIFYDEMDLRLFYFRVTNVIVEYLFWPKFALSPLFTIITVPFIHMDMPPPYNGIKTLPQWFELFRIKIFSRLLGGGHHDTLSKALVSLSAYTSFQNIGKLRSC